MAILQFIVSGDNPAFASGKNVKTYMSKRKHTAPMLMGRPALPRLQRRGGSSMPRARLMATHEIEIVYEVSSAPTLSETMALKATVLPRLMRESRQVMMKETAMAFNGMSQPGRTC